MYKIAYDTFNDYVRFYYVKDEVWTNNREEAYVFTDWVECSKKLDEVKRLKPSEEVFYLDKLVASYSNVKF